MGQRDAVVITSQTGKRGAENVAKHGHFAGAVQFREGQN
jgi:hypothetical protein